MMHSVMCSMMDRKIGRSIICVACDTRHHTGSYNDYDLPLPSDPFSCAGGMPTKYTGAPTPPYITNIHYDLLSDPDMDIDYTVRSQEHV
jgi:hypothetical protein